MDTKEGEIATAFQPEQVFADSETVHLETTIGGVLGSRQQYFGGTDAIVADEVSRNRNLGAAFDVGHELVELLRRVREELTHAEKRVEWTRRFIHLKRQKQQQSVLRQRKLCKGDSKP